MERMDRVLTGALREYYAGHFMVGFWRFLLRERKMPGFPTHIVGTPQFGGKPGATKAGKIKKQWRAGRSPERLLVLMSDAGERHAASEGHFKGELAKK